MHWSFATAYINSLASGAIFYANIYYLHLKTHRWLSVHVLHVPFVLCLSRTPSWCLKADTKAEHSMEHASDSGLVWTLLGLKGWYTGLLIRLFHVSTERLRLTSYAVFLTRSSDRSSSLFGFSIWVRLLDTVRQPAEETVAASGRLPTSGHVLSVGSKRHRALKIHDGLKDNVETL